MTMADSGCDCAIIRNAAGTVVAYVGDEPCDRHRNGAFERHLMRAARANVDQRRPERLLAAPGWCAPDPSTATEPWVSRPAPGPSGGVLVMPKAIADAMDRAYPWAVPGLTPPDILWVQAHWRLAGGPGLDGGAGWVTTERVR